MTLAKLRQAIKAMPHELEFPRCNPITGECRCGRKTALAALDELEREQDATLKTIAFLCERNTVAALEMINTMLNSPAPAPDESE